MMAARGQTLYFRATVGLGAGVLVLAAVEAAAVPVAVLALGAAAVLATELVQVPGDEHSLDPVDAQPFSFASPTHLALVVAVGLWPAALLAGLGVVVVDLLRGAPRRAVAFNASVFALATAGGGAAFALFGGTPGTLALPQELAAYVALAAVYVLLNLSLVDVMTALAADRSPLGELRNVLRTDLSSRFAEAGLGLLIGYAVVHEPWTLVACAPLVVVVYRAYERLAQLRRETARALETFANVVDERDPYTYSHSSRVAADVEALGEALGLPSAQVARLRWAGRLHDLGKIAVDSSVLNKPGRLDAAEFEAMRRHARLSARMLRRFRLAADEARAVEYHHERHDGKGYYGIRADAIPLAASILAVADSYDAMTSDRAYRPGMSEADALAEIERCAGTHFHPSVARAFVELKRGGDPRIALPRTELRTLRGGRSRPCVPSWAAELSAPALTTLAGGIAGLVALAMGAAPLALAGAAVVAAGFVWNRRRRYAAQELVDGLRAAVGASSHPFAGLVRSLSRLEQLDWIGLVHWEIESLTARVAFERAGLAAVRPSDDALTSWLVRDAEGGTLLVAAGAEVGVPGAVVALPLGEDGRTAVHWLVLGFRHDRPGWLDEALLEVRGDLTAAFAGSDDARTRLQRVAAAV